MTEIKPSYSDLLDEMISLKGYKIIQEIELLKGTNYTFVRNFYELMETIREYEQDNEIWYLQNRQKLHLMQLEVLRLLHNFTSSVLTLIDHTRNFRKKIEEKKLDATFETEIKNLILNDVVIFMKQLRQYFQHYSLPVTNAQIHVTIIPGTENQYTEQQKLQLDIDELMKWTRWNRQSKRYLDKFDKNVEIKIFCNEYYNLIEEFYNEFYNTVLQAYNTEIIELNEFRENVTKLYPLS